MAELGHVLIGEEEGRRSDEEITVFDSTGLAVQDLAVAVAVYEHWRANRERAEFVGVTEIAL
jgi:ornithine cyclodeaminase/alanine dehydrogenase-like protein (mu-crystallin family)